MSGKGKKKTQQMLRWMKDACMLSHFSCVGLFATRGLYPARLPCPWDSPGKKTGVGCHFLLQGRRWKWMEICNVMTSHFITNTTSHTGDDHSLLNPEIELTFTSLMSPTLADGCFTTSTTWEAKQHFDVWRS